MAKPSLTVGVLGHLDHGKTTLTQALVARRGCRAGRSALAEYETATRRYRLIDCSQHVDSLKQLIAQGNSWDAALLVVAGDHGIMPQTRQQTHIARLVGVPRFVVFLSKVDLVTDRDLLDLAEMEVRELLSQHEYPGDDVPIVRGDARAAWATAGRDDRSARCIDELLAALDDLPLPEPREAGPFLMPVADTFFVRDRVLATGRVAAGTLGVGGVAELVGLRPAPRRVVVTEIQSLPQHEGVAHPHPTAAAGTDVAVFLDGVGRDDLEAGMVLAAPGSITAHTRFEAVLYLLSHTEGGRHGPIFSGYRPQLHLHGSDGSGRLTLAEEFAMPGDVVSAVVELLPDRLIALEAGMHFALCEGDRTVGVGTVTRVVA